MQADCKALTEGLSDPRRELRMGASEVMKGLSTLAHAALGGALSDPMLAVTNAEVAPLGPSRGPRRRMTLTYPAIDRAGCIHWVVAGAEERAMLVRLRDADRSIPAGRLRKDHAVAFAGRAAAAGLGNGSAC